MRKKPLRAKRVLTGRSIVKKTRKSRLATEAETFFNFGTDAAMPSRPEPEQQPPTTPVYVQTFTTYSACEEPIPNTFQIQKKS
jgi:hypothetical protein